MNDPRLRDAIAAEAIPLHGAPGDYQPLLEAIGGARFVLLGEASHGTHEFYRERALITRHLIAEHGFGAVAIEGDFTDAARVDRFVRALPDDGDLDAIDALRDFRRFPQWMWRNADVLDFIGWLRAYNDHRPSGRGQRVGLYGLDLYGMHGSMSAVVDYLARVDPAAAPLARARYSCFGAFGDDAEAYGWAARLSLTAPCTEDVVRQLAELEEGRARLIAAPGGSADAQFAAEQNARVVRSAEEYYRSMMRGHVSSWNLRDSHMADTLDALADHLDERGRRTQNGAAKIVVWAHNSHVGDARATSFARAGEHTLGQLMRERARRLGEVALVGFTTYAGTVSAAQDWGEPVRRMRVREALPESYEALFHSVGMPRFLLDLRALGSETERGLEEPRLERAIGVVYRPESERASHYLTATLPGQLDLVIHIDETRAVEPLERHAGWDPSELPATYPDAM